MSQFGPFETRVEIMERATHFIDLMIRNNDPNITAWRIYGHRLLNDAYGNPTGSGVGGAGPLAFINQVGREQGFRSPLLIQRGLGFLESRAQLRRMSRIMFDPDDYASAPEMPSDRGLLFVRVQEFAITVGGWREVLGIVDTGDPILGPIVVIPNALFYGKPNAPLSLAGTAPGNTGAVAGGIMPLNEDSQLPNPMHVVLPRPGSVKIKNLDGAATLLYSFGLGQPVESLPANGEVEVIAGVKELLLAGDGATTPAFNITAVINLGLEL